MGNILAGERNLEAEDAASGAEGNPR